MAPSPSPKTDGCCSDLDSEPLLNRRHPLSSATMLYPSRQRDYRRGSVLTRFVMLCYGCGPASKSRCFFVLLLVAVLSFVIMWIFVYRCRGWRCEAPVPQAGLLPTLPPALPLPNLPKGKSENRHRVNDDELASRLIVLNQRDRLYTSTVPVNFVDYDTIQQDGTQFNVDGSDVMVFLHVQKTGGTTFEKHLVNDIDLEAPCDCKTKKRLRSNKGGRRRGRRKKQPKRCQCFRPGSKTSSWLFSRYNTGWKCGLHADWTELTECVDAYLDASEGVTNRRYFYMTFLRDPVARYISEYLHVRRGATWKGSLFMCNGRPASQRELPPCYNGTDWSGVDIEGFGSCPSNMAFNRQTRMLADLRLVNCYNRTTVASSELRDRTMLESAKANLRKMAFFGLTSQQTKSQFLFEDTFNLKFKVAFEEREEDQHYVSALPDLTEEIMGKIRSRNSLDTELYEYAKELMDKRFEEAKGADPTYSSGNSDPA